MAGPQSEKERNARRQGAAYQAAVEAVFAILIAAGIGYWLDGWLGTAPIGLLVGVVLGFTAFVLRLLRLGQRLREEEAGGGTPGDAKGGTPGDGDGGTPGDAKGGTPGNGEAR